MREFAWHNVLPDAIQKKCGCVQITADAGNNGNICLVAEALGKAKKLTLMRWFPARDHQKAVKLAWAIALNCKCPDDLTNFRKSGQFVESELPAEIAALHKEYGWL